MRKLQHSHQLALRQHRNQKHGARNAVAIQAAEKRAAPRVRDGQQGALAVARRNGRRQARFRRRQIHAVRRATRVHGLQCLRAAILDIKPDARSAGKRRKSQRQPTQNLRGRRGADHFLAQRVEQMHLFAKRCHAPLPDPPDGQQRRRQDQRRQQHRRLDQPASFQHRDRRRAGHQNLKILVVRRQRAVLAGHPGHPHPVASAESTQLRTGISPRSCKKYRKALGFLADHQQIAARILISIRDDALGCDQNSQVPE